MSETTAKETPRLTPAQALKAAEDNLKTALDEKAALESKVTKLEGDLQASEDLATETQSNLDKLQGEHDTLKSERDELSTKATDLESKVASLEGEHDKLKADNADLEAKEQDIDKRATAMFAAKQAAIGEGGPLATGTPAGGEKQDPESKSLTGYERTLAALKEKNAQNSQ